jgi:hypothetical protein
MPPCVLACCEQAWLTVLQHIKARGWGRPEPWCAVLHIHTCAVLLLHAGVWDASGSRTGVTVVILSASDV